ncbi:MULTISPECIES: MFS transporter [Frankia]|uniref:Membrane transport protein n=1 Tax=Frankia alni (strain DSM 45986 / CECT 9034 / ACN14a) TaxID=326424 RepID=Q0RBE8_FRAAA|nr:MULTISPECIES: MFS transporter [Frankia]CAJ65238.1 putative membrane transport protein [Frankia alni ACN14a]
MAQASADPTSRQEGAPAPGLMIGALATAGVVVSVMHTLVVPLISDLPELLHSSASNTAWVVTATLLGAAVSTPIVGRLGDMYGKKRMMMVSLVVLIIGSVVCALSTSLLPMVAGRALQGLATGLIPLGISVMRDELPPEKLGSALGLMSSSLGIGGALGVPLSAIIAQQVNWHVLFWGAAGLAVLVLLVIWKVIPESPVGDKTHGRFDFVGALGMSAGVLCLLLVISKGSDWGWTKSTTLGLGVAAVVILLAWGFWELRTPSPLVDLRISARRQVLMTNLTSVIIGFAMYGMSLIIPQLLQAPKGTGYGFGQSMIVAGLCFAPFGLVMMLASPVTARLSAAFGSKVTLMLGAGTIAIGYGLGLVLMSEVWEIIFLACIIGLGVALAYASMPALIMAAVPPTETAAANGLNTLMRSLGTSSSAAVVGVVLAHMTTTFEGVALPSEGGFRLAFVLGAGSALLALLLATFIPGRQASAAVTVPSQRETRSTVTEAETVDAVQA